VPAEPARIGLTRHQKRIGISSSMPDVRFDNACFATDSPVRLSIAASPAQGALISTFDRHISGVKRLRGSSRLISGFNLPIGFDESVRCLT
jgi:hypothetical protein